MYKSYCKLIDNTHIISFGHKKIGILLRLDKTWAGAAYKKSPKYLKLSLCWGNESWKLWL